MVPVVVIWCFLGGATRRWLAFETSKSVSVDQISAGQPQDTLMTKHRGQTFVWRLRKCVLETLVGCASGDRE
jgi:hypothetical protein